jgi:predicted DNA-binding transcriptional regulator YafY
MDQREKRDLLAAMRDPDTWVVRLRYKDSKGDVTIRVVSPVRIEGESVLALCLAREECRRFKLCNVSQVKLVRASDVLMPVQIIKLEDKG